MSAGSAGPPRFRSGPRPKRPPPAGGAASAQFPPEKRQRRALSHVGGEAEIVGAPELRAPLAKIVAVGPDEDATRAHVHGFHSYPARLHPALAAEAIAAFSKPGDLVLDPFCGSGTVVVEARLAGRRAIGIDANPLAVELARLKAEGRSSAHRTKMIGAAMAARELADERRQRRSGPSMRYPDEDRAAFDAHILLELDSLRVGIDAEKDQRVRGDLLLVLSSIFTKVGKKGGDSVTYDTPKRIAAGYPSKLFVKKVEELAGRLAAYEHALPKKAPEARVFDGDARAMPIDEPVDLVVTSPPYPGNYDYLHHHGLRLRWLGLPSEGLDEREIGARRKLETTPYREAVTTFMNDIVDVFGELRRLFTPHGRALFVIADSVIGKTAVYADDLVGLAAARAGLVVVGRASQARPHFHRPTIHAFDRKPRREHAIVLERAKTSR